MYQSYDLSRYIDGDLSKSTSITVSDDDAINCAHMLAAGFNTISRNFMHTYVLAVVDTEDGRVFYDGKVETINRAEPKPKATDEWPMNNYFTKTFTFEPSEGDADTILTLFGNGETPMFTAAGKLSFAEPDELETTAEFAKRVKREVLEAAYVELDAVKNVLFDAGVETIPADRGVKDLQHVLRARDDEIAELAQERANREQSNAAARAELIEHVQRAYAKWGEVDPGRQREGMKAHLRGMIEVLSTFLAAIGEADHDERHAVALRVCGIPEGNYLYVDD